MEEEPYDLSRKKEHPAEVSSSTSKLFFWWALAYFYGKYRKTTADDDDFRPLSKQKAGKLGDRLERTWLEELLHSRQPSLWTALWKSFWSEFSVYALVYMFIEFVLKMSQPLLIGKLMTTYAAHNTTVSSETEKSEIYLYSILILATSFLNVMVAHTYLLEIQHFGMRIRVAISSLIYRKTLKISQSALGGDQTVGHLVNLLSNDVSRFDLAPMHFLQFLVAPLEAIILLGLMFYTVGWTATAGVGFLLVFIPCQLYMGKLTAAFRRRTATKTDQRIKLMNEIISGIQVIKMYTWEKAFVKLVENARRLEVDQIKLATYLRGLNVSFMIFLNRTGIFLCVVTYVLYYDKIDAKQVFVVTAFYAILRQTLTVYLPFGFNSFNETRVSVHRIEQFLCKEDVVGAEKEMVTYVETKNGKMIPDEMTPLDRLNRKPKISLQNVTLKYTSRNDCALDNLNFEAESDKLIAILGEVGSGKSSLLQVILKEIAVTQGTVLVEGSVSYASQEPWLFSSSVRQNIIFGREIDEDRYDQVVEACCLRRDFGLLRNGDKSIVGEKGVLLSGGQKARINLARAVYKNADIYLLDDPLSAVDARVGNEIFNKCLKGFLKDKCTILVTHQSQYLYSVDEVYFMSRGTVLYSGNADSLRQHKTEISDVLKKQMSEPISLENDNLTENGHVPQGDPEVFNEKSKTGNISKSVYRQYLKAGGSSFLICIIGVLFVLTQIGASGSDYFPAFWVNQELAGYTETVTRELCTYIFTAIIIFTIIITIVRSLMFFSFCLGAALRLHNDMFSKIVKAPMRFFNTNSTGVILNRFSKDMGLIDETVPVIAMDTIQIAFIVVGLIAVVSIVNPWILIPGVIIFVVSYFFRIMFLASSRNLKRKEATARSPVYSRVTATIQGLSTIRAFDAGRVLKTEFDQHQDNHTAAAFIFLTCNRAFGFWLDMFCVFFAASVILSIMFMDTYAGNIGLSITQAISLTGVFQWGMRQWSELENQMTSVERVVEYTYIQPESDNWTKTVVEDWPQSGAISFGSVSLRYSLTDVLVLKNISFDIQATEKIGIVGRTGAGKSSLIAALFRLASIEGNILIDGVNTQDIPLEGLRSKISIIPQEPVLFSGSLRNNLDPFLEYDDAVLWDALEQVQMKELVTSSPKGLLLEISEGGSNFSVGQKQLICLARAILRNNKILVLDEATANVDPRTDSLIQAAIKERFKDCTVLTVAHRLNTVIDCDRILVLDDGQMVEFDHPYSLLQKSGPFCKLVQETGDEKLVQIANQNYQRLEDSK